MPDKVSIITPVYNNKDDIVKAITSVLNQTYKVFEMIIVDDMSNDGTYDIVLQFLNQIKDKRFILMRNSKNFGCYTSINEGIKKSTGDYITLLGSDDTFVPTKLEKQVTVMKKNKDLIGVDAHYQRETIIRTSNEVTLLFRREVITKIGFYDSVRFAADSEFKDRLTKVYGPGKIQKIPEILYLATIRKDSLTRSKDTGKKCVRQEYRKNFARWHAATVADKLYMPYPLALKDRPFPVIPIMLP